MKIETASQCHFWPSARATWSTGLGLLEALHWGYLRHYLLYSRGVHHG